MSTEEFGALPGNATPAKPKWTHPYMEKLNDIGAIGVVHHFGPSYEEDRTAKTGVRIASKPYVRVDVRDNMTGETYASGVGDNEPLAGDKAYIDALAAAKPLTPAQKATMDATQEATRTANLRIKELEAQLAAAQSPAAPKRRRRTATTALEPVEQET